MAQLLVVPVGFGTSAHLIGTGLAALLVGPAVAIVCVAAVVVVQALVLADGGVTALGLNLINDGLVPALVTWGLFVLARPLVARAPAGPLRRRRAGVTAGLAAAAGALAAGAAAAVAFVVGGTDAVPAATVAASTRRRPRGAGRGRGPADRRDRRCCPPPAAGPRAGRAAPDRASGGRAPAQAGGRGVSNGAPARSARRPGRTARCPAWRPVPRSPAWSRSSSWWRSRPPAAPWALAADAAVAAAVATIALVDWRAVAGRLTLDLPLAVLAVIYALAGRAAARRAWPG